VHKSVKACVLTTAAAALLTSLAAPSVAASATGSMAFNRIHNAASGLCLAARAGTGERPAIQTTCDNEVGKDWPDQHWTLEKVVSGTDIYRLRNLGLNLCLAARGSGEAQAFATTCDRDSGHVWQDQHWIYLYDAKRNASRWQNRATGNCLAARGLTESPAIATTCDSDWLDQYWKF
jgi:hypothetical protein